jgi:signal transduction histidine kinase
VPLESRIRYNQDGQRDIVKDRPGPNETMVEQLGKRVRGAFLRFYFFLFVVLVFLFAVVVGAAYALSVASGQALRAWLPTLLISGLALAAMVMLVVLLAGNLGTRVGVAARDLVQEEYQQLRSSNSRARSLQYMASTLRATLSFERVVEAALDVCSEVLQELGVPARAIAGAVFLYDRQQLIPVATRSFIPNDLEVRIEREAGIIGKALEKAEPAVTHTPKADPALSRLLTFQDCETAVCIPLRTGFQIFGVLLIGSERRLQFHPSQLEYFNAVADQAVIALQNAQLYQDLRAEKQRMVQADEEARKELARDLHDGPTQSVAAIAMRINFIRSLIDRDPEQALEELDKVERLARETSQEIRGMLFTLRPLLLETEGLAAALEAVINRIRETDNLMVRMVGEEHTEMLNERAQGVVFSVIEEALGNARKYAHATLIDVRFWRESDLFVAQVQDNGVGFDVHDVNDSYSIRGSLGLVNMQERAERIDGSLRIESEPGAGTTVTMVLPLSPDVVRQQHPLSQAYR